MRKLLQAAGLALAVALAWYGIWSVLVAADVARVKNSIAYQYQHLRTANRFVSLEADSVSAAGFPFAFHVVVRRATLSMVDGNETFAVSIPELTMEKMDSAQGIFRVILPNTVQALYAKDGQAPEHYLARVDAMPVLNLSAQDATNPCGFGTDRACPPVAADAPLVSYALAVPKAISVHMELAADARDVTFDLAPMALPVPVYQPIPANMSGPLQLAVGVLREALVYKKQ